jgi:Leucine-rich repeat (LRR) protein
MQEDPPSEKPDPTPQPVPFKGSVTLD